MLRGRAARDVGIVNYLPFYGGLGAATDFTVEGRPAPPPGEAPFTDVRQGLLLTGIGIVLGLADALALTRLLSSLPRACGGGCRSGG